MKEFLSKHKALLVISGIALVIIGVALYQYFVYGHAYA